jgi:Na+/melibiose symporter-like transporter
MKCTVVLLFNIGFQFFYNFYFDAYDSLINVLSPNSIERSDVLSIRSVVENLSPSIVNIVFPLLAKLITGEDTLYDMRIYRYIYPPMLFAGFLISLIIYVNTSEKIVQAKTHRPQIRFIDAFRAVARNKYFWIISMAGWIGFLEIGFHNIMQWMYNYQDACSAAQYSIITAIAGNASFWPNLVGPLFIRKYGKKKILIITNALSVVFILAMLPVIGQAGKPGAIWILLIFTFINQFITSLGHLLGPSVNADIRDYQHYITGERIDGMFSAVGLIGNAITMVTGLALPAIYERTGLNRETAISLGYDGSVVYEVLNDKDYFIRICSVLIIASAIGAALNVIPYFFYDFTEAKQKAVISVLKIRAMFEDYANNRQDEDIQAEATEIIRKSSELCKKEMWELNGLKGKELSEKRKENEEIGIARFVMEELEKFSTPEGKAELSEAYLLTANGPESFLTAELPPKAELKALPQETQTQINRRRDALTRLQTVKTAKKTVRKYYKNGIEAFDETLLDELYKTEHEIAQQTHDVLGKIKAAKENDEREAVREYKSILAELKAKKKENDFSIRVANHKYTVYCRAVKPYIDAKRIIAQAECYSKIDEILSV